LRSGGSAFLFRAALATQLFDAGADRREIVSSAGSGHVSSSLFSARPLGAARLTGDVIPI
jgi:hypothetical protein